MKKLIYLIVLLLLSNSAYTAEVKKRLKKKRIMISEGKDSGFKKGVKVCIYKDDEQVACGKVIKAKSKSAYVKIKKSKDFKKIKKGMEAKIDGDKGDDKKEGISPKVAGATNIKLGYILTPITPGIFNVPSYSDPQETTVNTLWSADQVSSLSIFGITAEFGFGIGSSKAVIGVRSREYKSFSVATDYTSDSSNFAETSISGISVGGYFDFNYLIWNLGSMTVDFGNGLDLDNTTVSLQTSHRDDADTIDNSLYTLESILQTVSLRTNLNINLFLDPLGIQIGTTLLIPLSSAVSDTIITSDTNNTYLSELTAEQDIRQAVDHRQGSVGLELNFSAYIAF